MHKILQNKFLSYSLIILLLILLISIRALENSLFYDPFLNHFKTIFHNKPLPDYNFLLLLFNYFVRFLINSSLSILIIYILFQDTKIIKLLIYIYCTLFLILILGIIILLILNNPYYNYILFNLRRFIMQPLFLILFVPAIYFQKISKIK